jgi:hypothetical protein
MNYPAERSSTVHDHATVFPSHERPAGHYLVQHRPHPYNGSNQRG